MAQGSRRRGRIFIYLALILLLCVALVFIWLNKPLIGLGTEEQTSGSAAQTETVNIVITTQQVLRGTPFTEAVLTTIPYPKDQLIPGLFFTNLTDVVGKRASADTAAQVPVTASMITENTAGSVASFEIPKGMVAISIPVNRLSSISYALQPGDHVNLLATLMFVDLDQNYQTILPNHTSSVNPPNGETSSAVIQSAGEGSEVGRAEMDPTIGQPLYQVPSEVQRPRMVTTNLLQDVVILQVGNFQSAKATSASGTDSAQSTTDQANAETTAPTTTNEYDVITVIVTPQDALTINYLLAQRNADGSAGAQLTMVLRSAGDGDRVQTEAITLQYLMEAYSIPLPAKQNYGLEPKTGILTPAWLSDANIVQPK